MARRVAGAIRKEVTLIMEVGYAKVGMHVGRWSNPYAEARTVVSSVSTKGNSIGLKPAPGFGGYWHPANLYHACSECGAVLSEIEGNNGQLNARCNVCLDAAVNEKLYPCGLTESQVDTLLDTVNGEAKAESRLESNRGALESMRARVARVHEDRELTAMAAEYGS